MVRRHEYNGAFVTLRYILGGWGPRLPAASCSTSSRAKPASILTGPAGGWVNGVTRGELTSREAFRREPASGWPEPSGPILSELLLRRTSRPWPSSPASRTFGGEDPAAGLRGSLLEGALDLLSYPPQIRERVLPALHDEPIRMPEPGAQRSVVLGDIAGERGDDTHGRFVVEPRSRPGPWVLLAIADDEFEVTSQGRLDQLFVAQTVQVVHSALSISSRQWVNVQALGPAEYEKSLPLSVTGMDVLL
jgi:hypothetical protein